MGTETAHPVKVAKTLLTKTHPFNSTFETLLAIKENTEIAIRSRILQYFPSDILHQIKFWRVRPVLIFTN